MNVTCYCYYSDMLMKKALWVTCACQIFKGLASLVALLVKTPPTVQESAFNAGDPGSICGLGRPPGEGNGNLLQYSCLKNPMVRGAW